MASFGKHVLTEVCVIQKMVQCNPAFRQTCPFRHLTCSTQRNRCRSSEDSREVSGEEPISAASARTKDGAASEGDLFENVSVPEPPTNCCMSGCHNCVWIEYAENIAKIYKDGGAKAREALRNIPDANVRAFVELEMKFR